MTLNAGSSKTVSRQERLPIVNGTSARRAPPKPPARESVLYTPEMAKAVLDTKNATNRPLRMTDVKEYARRMDNGEWHLNGEGLKFDEDGMLFEGQHRLMAVVMHGKPVWFEEVRNLPREDRFNDGGRPRSMADYLVIAQIVSAPSQGTKAAAIVEILGSLIAGKPRAFKSRNSEHKSEVIALGREYQAEILWALETFPSGAFAPVVGAFTYAYSAKGQKVDDFAKYWMSGERSVGSPAGALDNLLKEITTTARNGGSYRLEIAQRVLSGIYAHIKGKRLGVLRRSQQAQEFFKGRK